MHILSKIKITFLNMSIRRKIFSLFLIIGLLPCFLYMLYATYYTRQQIQEREQSLTASALQQAVMSVENKLKTYNDLSDYFYNNQSILSALNTKYNEHYFQMYLTYRDVFKPVYNTYYAIYSELKDITIYSSSDLHPSSYVQRLDKLTVKPWFSLVENQHASTWIVWEEGNSQQIFSVRLIGTPYRYQSINYLYLQIDYESLFSPFRSISEDSYDILIIDLDGNPVFSTTTSPYQDLEKISTDEKDQYMVLTNTISAASWKVYFYKTNADIRAYIRNLTSIFYFLLLLILCLFGIMMFLVSQYVICPIETLTTKIRDICSNNSDLLTVDINSCRKDEVGILFHDFSKMMERIQYYIDVNMKNELEKKTYQLKILYAQINPHFLYNALSLINSRAIMADQEDISQMALLLSTFYRTSLNQGNDMTTLENELLNIKAYVQLQLLSYNEPIFVFYDIDKNFLKVTFPNFILQPLVENALDHGLKNCRKKDKQLLITVKRQAEFLSICIRDNGVGMTEDDLYHLSGVLQGNPSKVTTETTASYIHLGSYGIRNVDERLRLIYGNTYSLTFTSKPGEGTEVNLMIPI